VQEEVKGLIDAGVMQEGKAAKARSILSSTLEQMVNAPGVETAQGMLDEAINTALKGSKLSKSERAEFSEKLMKRIAQQPREFLSKGAVSTPLGETDKTQDSRGRVLYSQSFPNGGRIEFATGVGEASLFSGQRISWDLTAIDNPPKGTGAATRMFVEILRDAAAQGLGYESDSILSDEAVALHERVKRNGVPFRRKGGVYFISPRSLAKAISDIDLEVAKESRTAIDNLDAQYAARGKEIIDFVRRLVRT
jgi:hypothetical protein